MMKKEMMLLAPLLILLYCLFIFPQRFELRREKSLIP